MAKSPTHAASFRRAPAAALCTAAAALALLATPAAAKPAETNLASPAQALAYCKSGTMPAHDVAYFAGPGGNAQYGPASGCVQKTPTKGTITKAIRVKGSKVAECNMVNGKQALSLCNSGAIGEYDIDYISGKVGQTLSGPGYGCVLNFSSVSVGGTVCK